MLISMLIKKMWGNVGKCEIFFLPLQRNYPSKL